MFDPLGNPPHKTHAVHAAHSHAAFAPQMGNRKNDNGQHVVISTNVEKSTKNKMENLTRIGTGF